VREQPIGNKRLVHCQGSGLVTTYDKKELPNTGSGNTVRCCTRYRETFKIVIFCIKIANVWRIMTKYFIVGTEFFHHSYKQECRLQWPRVLRHELSSPAQTLGSWVRIPLEAWMSVCVYSVFVLSCVQVAALRRAELPSQESYRL
jgi:hypothetical protein